jgi:alanyl-tRNA synthetase
VNKGDARCIEIWNLVFIQFNANPDGTFSPLPARHVDTGMGFERVTPSFKARKGFSDFAHARDRKFLNYETDIFRPIFEASRCFGRSPRFYKPSNPLRLTKSTKSKEPKVRFGKTNPLTG